jgi:hypothetical protein
MKKLSIVSALLLAFAAPAAQADGSNKLKVRLVGFNEVPSVSSPAVGEFEARIHKSPVGDITIEWELAYSGGFNGTVTQSHIHFGQRHVNGGISIFLCSNLGNGPAGTQPCPAGPARISGEATAAQVIGPTAQAIGPGEIEEIVAAIRSGAAYVNIHTTAFPGGEVRGQFHHGNDRHHH